MSTDQEPRLWGTVDPDLLAPLGGTCGYRPCALYPDHDGPHIDAHYISGRIFGIWTNTGEPVLPGEVSGDAVRLVTILNRARDEAVEAVDYVLGLKDQFQRDYAESEDEHVHKLLKSGIWPSSQHEISLCGTDAGREAQVREELLGILGLNSEEEL